MFENGRPCNQLVFLGLSFELEFYANVRLSYAFLHLASVVGFESSTSTRLVSER